MNKLIFFLAALALTLSTHAAAAPTATDADARAARQAMVDKAWGHIEDAAAGVREGMEDAFLTVKNAVSDLASGAMDAAQRVRHDRPFLVSEYIDVVKKGNQVSLLYCDSRLARAKPIIAGAVGRQAEGQSCEKLHTGSFSVADLKGCLKNADENKQPGMILNRQFSSNMVKDNEFKVDHFKMFDTKDDYKEYLATCSAQIASRKPKSPRVPSSPVNVAPAPPVAEQPTPEFHPVTPQAEPASPIVNGTL